jgi:hypothetical protein
MGYGVIMKKPRVYIAGPMRGLPFYNFPAFDKATMSLSENTRKLVEEIIDAL